VICVWPGKRVARRCVDYASCLAGLGHVHCAALQLQQSSQGLVLLLLLLLLLLPGT
jgi:hypothetical protein